MTDGDDYIHARLTDDYGHGWTFSWTLQNGEPHWWMATRTRRLTDNEIERGLSQTLIYDNAQLLRAALVAQDDIQDRMAAGNPAAFL